MKKILSIVSLLTVLLFTAQEKSEIQKSTYLKANALFLPVGVLNAGVETQLSKKFTFQGDIFISPWKSFAGKYAQIYMIGFDGRYYFKEAFKHFYVAANLSAAKFKIQKWNYWGNHPYQYTPDSPVYNISDIYQKGYSMMFGATVGYQFKLSENWNMDIYLGGGSSQDFYKGLHKDLGIRYDDPTRKWNKSGEWIPYRGGVMIAYKIK